MNDFFKKQTSSSRIKASIVAEYFPQYCKILLKKPQPEIRFLDLFSGPGIYDDQSHSTPLLIAKTCANDPILLKKVRLLFNDNQYSKQLKENFFKNIPAGTFYYEPIFGDKTVGEDEKILNYLKQDAIVEKTVKMTTYFQSKLTTLCRSKVTTCCRFKMTSGCRSKVTSGCRSKVTT